MPYFAESPGVVVDIHNPHKYPFPEDTGIKLAPGETTSIGLLQVRGYLTPVANGENISITIPIGSRK